MPDVEASIVIAAPIETVFDYYARYDRHPEWQPELVRAELVTDGPVASGTRGLEVRRMLGREVTGAYEITEHEPPYRSSFRTLDGPLRPSGVATFTPVDGGTRMSFELELGARGPLRLVAPLMRLLLTPQTRSHLQRFKEVAETRARVSANEKAPSTGAF